ncbi:unnamed protein product [Pieris brassicae]|uniref:Uncharacterized protein n=1 Tax=Pieris brassicae TaxID=7116 RepID=A0A9P0TR28_PIEBR|nr:unnamed protein product [Pieris brassicae]
MKFLLLCLLAAYCYADNSSESLISKIQDHQKTLRVWEEDNSGLLASITEKQKKYDNAKKNEVGLLQTVDYLVKTNMEMLENVLTELKKIRINLNEDGHMENKYDIGEDTLSNKYPTDSDTLTLEWLNYMKENDGK